MAKTVESYLEKNNNWSESLKKLRSIALDTELKEEVKWGAPAYTLDGKNVVGIVAFKSYVGLWFYQGVFLNDEENLLEASSDETKGLRKMTFQSHDEILMHEKSIESYIQEAIKNQEEGKEIKVSKKKKVIIPDLLKDAMDEDTKLKKCFKSLSAGKQREYSKYIKSAKRESTKLRRLDKIIPLIKKKQGLHDKYK